jgi:ribonuclease J
VIPHLVDHSSFGAFAFEIEAGGKRVFYTGDFREHGYIGGKTLEIIGDKCAPGVDALLMEGTMLGRTEETVQTEQQLANEVIDRYKDFPKALLVYQSGQNVSRAVSFYKAALKLDRELVLDFYTAHVLAELGQCRGGEKLPYPGNLPGIKVWYPHWLTERMKRDGRWDLINRFAGTPFKLSRYDMPARLDKIMLYVRPPMDYDLKRIPGIGGSMLLYSLWSGYLKAGPAKSFVDKLQKLGIEKHIIHTSGHAPVATLQRLVDTLQPRKLFSIHTLHPEQYGQFGVEVQELNDGEECVL